MAGTVRRLLFDIETDGFLEECTQVHCIAAVDVDSGALWDWGPDGIHKAVAFLGGADILIGHNIQRFDLPVLNKLYDFETSAKVIDTMICARLIKPNVRDTDAELVARGEFPLKDEEGNSLIGKHSLQAWGLRLGEHKTVYKGVFEEWSQELHEYMVQDVKTNLALWKFLDVDNYSQEAIELEHRIARICDQIEKEGAPFDSKAAQKLHAELIGKKHEVEQELIRQFGSWQAPVSKEPFVPKKDNAKLGYKKGVPVFKMKTVTFNPGSREHIAKVLQDRGWKPKAYTPTGKPQIDENVVTEAAKTIPEAKGLADYLMLDKRLSQLADGEQAWLKAVRDGRIHGVINPMGTTTSRASHFNPNLAQVPAVKSPYGKECRALFKAGEGKVLVGADMDGLELRGFAHYLKPLDGGAYEQLVLAGDPHWANVIAMGLYPEGTEKDKDNRLHVLARESGAKRFIYAFIYGAGNKKVGEIILDLARAALREGDRRWADKFFPRGEPSEENLRYVGGKIRQTFLKRTPGLAGLKDSIARRIKKDGILPGLDKRKIPVRAEHSALNFVIQSAGAILCKRWLCDAFDEITTKYPGDANFVLWVHDEVQVECRKEHAKDIGDILVKHARAAGAPYAFRVPLDSSYSVGSTWADTH